MGERIKIRKKTNLNPKLENQNNRESKSISSINQETSSKDRSIILLKEHLRSWLRIHQEWSHEDWLDLLESLEEKGYDELVASQAGINAIGEFLEKNRYEFIKTNLKIF